MSFFKKIKELFTDGSKKITNLFTEKLNFFLNSDNFSEENLNELEEILLEADVGFATTEEILEIIKNCKYLKTEDQKISLKTQIHNFLTKKISKLEAQFTINQDLNIIILCGVNGAGKTTTIRKICHRFSDKKTLVACCDTFRAAAYEQLQIGIQDKAEFFEYTGKNTPDSVAYKAIIKAREENFDILFLDTSGRLQNNRNLMEEFTKFSNIIKKIDPNLSQRIILVLDGSSGQNIINQIEIFSQNVKLTGLILTKFDGLTKGGIILQIATKFDFPIYFLGTGERDSDLENFDSQKFLQQFLDF